MADARPFRGMRFDPSVVGDLGAALSPPFDVISPQDEDALRSRSGYNIVRVEAPRAAAGGDPYAAAAETLSGWQAEGAVVRDPSPAYYVATHTFTYRGRAYSRTELTAAVRVEPFEAGAVKSHEDTRAGPKKVRLSLMTATGANVSPIMLLYEDDSALGPLLERTTRRSPDAVADLGEGQAFELWVVLETADVDAVRGALREQPLYIADGHHRYETALAYRRQIEAATPHVSPDGAHAFVMATLIGFGDPGLLSLPYHRLLRGLDGDALARLRGLLTSAYDEERHAMPGTSAASVAGVALDSLATDGVAFEVWGLEPGVRSTLSLKSAATVEQIAAGKASLAWASLGATLFRETILRPLLGASEEEAESRGQLAFGKDAGEAVETVNGGEWQLVFMPRAVPMPALKKISDRGERLPPPKRRTSTPSCRRVSCSSHSRGSCRPVGAGDGYGPPVEGYGVQIAVDDTVAWFRHFGLRRQPFSMSSAPATSSSVMTGNAASSKSNSLW